MSTNNEGLLIDMVNYLVVMVTALIVKSIFRCIRKILFCEG